MPIALLLFALIGAPIFVVIAASALWGFHSLDIDLSVVAIEIYGLAETPVLVAIPLFTVAGFLLSESQAPKRLLNLSEALLGWMPGGLAVVSIFACAFFTAFTGASGITIIALGALLYPALKAAGYPDNFNLGLVTSSGSLGLLFAPSLPLILYGVIAEVSIDDMFRAGILPGLLMLAALAVYSMWAGRGAHMERDRAENPSAKKALWDARYELPLPFIVLGGIYGGYMAISEAAIVTLVYVFIAEVLLYREVSFSRLVHMTRESLVLVGGIMVILAVSLASTNYFIDAGMPQKIFAITQGLITSKMGFILLLIVFLLILGAFLDIFSAIVLVVPLIIPVALAYNVDPVHLGIIFLATMQLGYMTPPVGINLFIASYRFDRSILAVYASTLPFFMLLLLVTVVIAFWPGLSLWLLADK